MGVFSFFSVERLQCFQPKKAVDWLVFELASSECVVGLQSLLYFHKVHVCVKNLELGGIMLGMVFYGLPSQTGETCFRFVVV